MQSATLALPSRTAHFRAVGARPVSRPARALVVRASSSQEDRPLHEKLALPAAALFGAALLFAATPDEALAARSGGRVGGSSGFSSRRAAPAPSQAAAPRVTNNYYSAPPVMGGWGFGMPMFGGFGGFGFYPVFGVGLGTIFNIMLIGIVIQVVLSVVSGFTNQKEKKKFDDEDW